MVLTIPGKWPAKNLRIFTLKIYDRYGKLLKEPGTAESWNGTFNGIPVPADDYWFHIDFANGDPETGHFTLIK